MSIKRERLVRAAQAAPDRGGQLAVHAIGDGAHCKVLEAFEAALPPGRFFLRLLRAHAGR